MVPESYMRCVGRERGAPSPPDPAHRSGRPVSDAERTSGAGRLRRYPLGAGQALRTRGGSATPGCCGSSTRQTTTVLMRVNWDWDESSASSRMRRLRRLARAGLNLAFVRIMTAAAAGKHQARWRQLTSAALCAHLTPCWAQPDAVRRATPCSAPARHRRWRRSRRQRESASRVAQLPPAPDDRRARYGPRR